MVHVHRAGKDVVDHLFDGGNLQFVHGDHITAMIWSFKKGAQVPAHEHHHEQVVHCIEGVLEVEAAGELYALEAGDSLVIPGGVPHSARAATAARGIDTFHPVREDYKF